MMSSLLLISTTNIIVGACFSVYLHDRRKKAAAPTSRPHTTSTMICNGVIGGYLAICSELLL